MHKIGDNLIYGSNGVMSVVDIREEQVGDLALAISDATIAAQNGPKAKADEGMAYVCVDYDSDEKFALRDAVKLLGAELVDGPVCGGDRREGFS